MFLLHSFLLLYRRSVMKYLPVLFLFFYGLNQGSAQTLPLTPPMGWNSYNCFGSAVHEDEVKANTDYMARILKPYGWEYIVVDFLWSYPNPPLSRLGNIMQQRLEDGSYIPWLAMDKWGRLLPDMHKFPSARAQESFRPLADYIHAAGLKFGIHLMRGIPRQAVLARTPVLGAPGITADMIADTSSVCAWSNHMYGLDMSKKGAQEYLNSLLDLYASWQVDFIKVDDLARPYREKEVEGYKKAIDQSGRPMVFSLSPGATPVSEAAHVSSYGTMWRLADDFWDDWSMVLNMLRLGHEWQGKGSEGHWPDCDMLQIGKLSKRGPVGPERFSRLTDQELLTHMTFWSIFRSPLMIGGNMPENRSMEESLFTNKEVIEVNQQGEHPFQVSERNNKLVWASHIQQSTDLYVALFNLAGKVQVVSIDFKALGLKGRCTVKDLWHHKNLGVFTHGYGQQIPVHGAALVRISSQN